MKDQAEPQYSPSITDNKKNTEYDLPGGNNQIVVTLTQPARVTEVKIYSGVSFEDRSFLSGARIYLITEENERDYCGQVYQTQTRVDGTRFYYTIACHTESNSIATAVQVDSTTGTGNTAGKISDIVVYGVVVHGGQFFTDEGPLYTVGLEPTEEPYGDRRIIENEVPDLVERDGVKQWDQRITEEIPYKVMNDVANSENPMKSPLGYLSFAGYIDYALDTDKAELGGGKRKQTKKPRTSVTQKTIADATNSFLQFNGYVENGPVTDDMVEEMKKPRCGNSDLIYTSTPDSCTVLGSAEAITIERRTVRKWQQFTLPTAGSLLFFEPEPISYYVEVDIQFPPLRGGRSKIVFIGFNYNSNAGITEGISLRFKRFRLCALFSYYHTETGDMEAEGLSEEKFDRQCYQPTATEFKLMQFKARVDVTAERSGIPARVSVTIKGREFLKQVFGTPLLSSVLVRNRADATITLGRLCKRTGEENEVAELKRRRKRYTLSQFKWQTPNNDLTFTFQNYSSILGQDSTRQGVLKAVELYSIQTGITFREVEPSETAQLIFMFIRGAHADGKAFHGAGQEKGHAFSPVHSEIHFNDYEQFSLDKDNSRSVSMFYVAAHEMGHALGVRHSAKRDAVMYASYPTDTAFSVSSLHQDDVDAIKVHYPGGSGTGEVRKLSNPGNDGGSDYIPKLPLPLECHKKIDAALSFNDFYWLTAGLFIWKFNAAQRLQDGFPKRVSDVFSGTDGTVDAMFAVSGQVFVLHSSNKVSTYTESDGGFSSVRVGADRGNVLTAGGTGVNKEIKSAFKYNSATILVTGDKGYYTVTWSGTTPSSIVYDSDGTKILGRDLTGYDLNGAFSYTRILKKKGIERQEILNFQSTYVRSEILFPGKPTNSKAFNEVAVFYGISGWCTSKNE